MSSPDATTGPEAGRDTVGLWPVVGALTALVLAAAILYCAIVPAATFRRSDFFGLWSCARIALTHGAGVLYRHAQLHELQTALGVPPDVYGPFPYPPTALLFLPPAGALPADVAYVLFMAASLAACAVAMFAGGSVFRISAMLVPALTAFMGNLVVGQTGFLTAALFIGGLRLARPRPVLGGVLIGLLTCKPQLGLLLPLALAAAGAWQCMFAAAATTAALSLAASLAFGWSIWGAWLQSLPHYAELFDHELHTLWLQPTVTAFLRSLAAPGWTVDLAQGASAAFALGLVWRLCRTGPTPRAIVGVAAATFLATPHAFQYDTVLLAAATLVYANERKQGATSSLFHRKSGWPVMAAMFLPPIALAIGPGVSVLVLWPVATLALLPRRDDVQVG